MSTSDPSKQPPWKPGDVVNGYRLNGAGTAWEPVEPAKKPWYKRPLGITGIAVGSLILLSAFGSAIGDDDPASNAPAARASVESTPTPTPEPEPVSTPTPSPEFEPVSTPTPAPEPPPRTYVVTHVVDGDTVDLDNGETVRVVGIDTPEQGECDYEAATRKLEELVLGKTVTLAESDEDRDRYDRLLRYVDVGKTDAGLAMIESGLAIARYDSRDGYGRHPREDAYIAADEASPNKACAPKPKPQPLVPQAEPANDCMAGYDPCLPVVSDLDCGEIDGPVRVTGNDPYGLDRDGDGIGCDS